MITDKMRAAFVNILIGDSHVILAIMVVNPLFSTVIHWYVVIWGIAILIILRMISMMVARNIKEEVDDV